MNEPMIELDGVDKTYRFFRLSDVRLRLEPGQIMGFVGPNGAGKSTTIRILMAMVRQERGTVRVLGRSLPKEQAAAKRDIGFVSEDMRLHGNATLGWHMRLVASIYPDWDATVRGHAAAPLQPSRRAADQGISRTASASKPRCCSCSRGVRGCCSSTSRPPASTPLPGTKYSPSSWTSSATSAAPFCFRRTTPRTSSRSPIRSRSSTAGGSSTRATRKRSSIAGADCISSARPAWRCPARGVVETTRQRPHRRRHDEGLHARPRSRLRARRGHVRTVQRMTLEEIFVANVMNNRREHAE